MHIWVDADACPAVIKDILYRAAERTKIPLTLVANKLLRTPPSPYIRALQVRHGIDVADSHIVRELAPGDLVVTADIPLAADVIAKGGHALNPRGEFYSPENIQERLALRNYLDELRGTGERTGGPAALDNTDRKRFADQLDRFLARLYNEGDGPQHAYRRESPSRGAREGGEPRRRHPEGGPGCRGGERDRRGRHAPEPVPEEGAEAAR